MGREPFSKPLPGEQERAIGAFKKFALLGPSGGETGLYSTYTAGTGSTSQNEDSVSVSQDGTDDAASVYMPATPKGVQSGMAVMYAGVRLSQSLDNFDTAQFRIGWTRKNVDSFGNGAFFDRLGSDLELTAASGASNSATVDSPPDLTTLSHFSIAVDYGADETRGYINSNPFVGEPDVEIASSKTPSVPDQLNYVVCGVEQGNLSPDTDEGLDVAYMGYMYVP
jgi:hypothetical protein